MDAEKAAVSGLSQDIPGQIEDHGAAITQVKAHRTMLRAYLLALLRDPFLADTTFAEITTTIARSWSEYDSRNPFERWAREIARRVALATLRSSRRKKVLLDPEVLDSLGAELDLMGEEAELEKGKTSLRDGLGNLSQPGQRLVHMRYFQNIPLPEMSIATGKSIAALYRSLNRIHQGFATDLKPGASHTPNRDDRHQGHDFEPLLYYLDGSLDAEGVAELNRRLKIEPVMQSQLALLLVQQLQLVEIGRECKVTPRSTGRETPPARQWPDRAKFRARLRRRLLKMGLATAVALGLALYLRSTVSEWLQDYPVVTSIQGFDVFLQRNNNRERAKPGTQLRPGDVIKTSDDGGIRLRARRAQTQLFIKNNTETRFTTSADGKTIEMLRGDIEYVAGELSSHRLLSINTPNAQLRVANARFNLHAEPAATCLEVIDGSVELWNAKNKRLGNVVAGQYGIIEPGLEQVSVLKDLPARGLVEAELFQNIRGTAVADFTSSLRFHGGPSKRVRLFTLETPPEGRTGNDTWRQLGMRVRGYILPPVTGNFTFWITADDAAEFWLSPNPEPAAKTRICWIESPAHPDEWTKEESQRSSPLHLESGRLYYFEVLHKQQWSPNFFRVAWEPPAGERSIIGGSCLGPFRP